MPLTEYQANLARLLSVNRTFDSYLAGGAAILIEPNTKRFSRDLDYFHDSDTRVTEAFSADRKILETDGYTLDVDLNQPGYGSQSESVKATMRPRAASTPMLRLRPIGARSRNESNLTDGNRR